MQNTVGNGGISRPIVYKVPPRKTKTVANNVTVENDATMYSNAWNTERINRYNYDLENGIVSKDPSPYLDGAFGIRRGDLVFDMTVEEHEEYTRCANDVVYFADKYCFAMTDDGVQKIELREYQKKMLQGFQDHRFNVLLASRQIGKTITASIYICWYICFNYDKNVLIVANKGKTMSEIVDKVKVVYRNLPFFLKPGMNRNNIESMWFDNGCRIQGSTTTGTSALGFTTHLLYGDEFAHIPPNIIEPFYRSIYPTLSSSKISRMIITSTANGLNKFHDIYDDALLGKNEFFPMRVDWWEVPGRDEKWMQQEISNLGSIELFNQEYGNVFLSSESLLLHPETIARFDRLKRVYDPMPLEGLEHLDLPHDCFMLSREWRSMPVNKKKDRFVLSIDLASGVGRDYTVINMFRLEPLSRAKIRKVREFKDETAFFRLKQIGLFRSNRVHIDAVAEVLSYLMQHVFGPEETHIVLEMNFWGDTLISKLDTENWFFIEAFLHTKHSQDSKIRKPGVRLNKQNKQIFCLDLKKLLESGRIAVTEYSTIVELTKFGSDNDGLYSVQSGNDDIAMSLVNLSAYFNSPEYVERVEEIVDELDDKVKELIQYKFDSIDYGKTEHDSYSYLKDIFQNKDRILSNYREVKK